MPEDDLWERTVPNQVEALMRAIETFDRWLEAHSASGEERYLGQLAFEELGTNIIKYGFDDQQEHLIHLSARAEPDLFVVCLQDDGHEFNPCQTPEPDPTLSLEERTPGGWGLSLVRRLSAGMDYERREGRNFVHVKVSRRHPAPP